MLILGLIGAAVGIVSGGDIAESAAKGAAAGAAAGAVSARKTSANAMKWACRSA